MFKCPKCQKELEDMDVPVFFCKYCGNKIERDVLPPNGRNRRVINLSKDQYSQRASKKSDVKDNQIQNHETSTNINVQYTLRASKLGIILPLMIVPGVALVIIGSLIINIIESIGLACIIIGGFSLFASIYVGAFGAMKKSSDKEEMRLQMIVEQIQVDIKNKDYISAKIKADTLNYGSGWSDNIKKKWNTTRELLVKHIEEAESKSGL